MRFSNLTKILVVICLSTGVFFQYSYAQIMESTSFQIQSDSINFAGNRSESDGFIAEDTFGEIATGEIASPSFRIFGGYQQMQEVYLSLSPAANVAMDNGIGGITGGVANGSTSVVATTDSSAGYQLSIQAESSPAMNYDIYSIADYDDGGSVDLTFNTPIGNSVFGYSPEGLHIADVFKDDGLGCGSGTAATEDACWTGLATSPRVVAQHANANHPSGTETVIKFRVGVGANAGQMAGTYVATTTITLLSL